MATTKQDEDNAFVEFLVWLTGFVQTQMQRAALLAGTLIVIGIAVAVIPDEAVGKTESVAGLAFAGLTALASVEVSQLFRVSGRLLLPTAIISVSFAVLNALDSHSWFYRAIGVSFGLWLAALAHLARHGTASAPRHRVGYRSMPLQLASYLAIVLFVFWLGLVLVR